MAIIDPLSVAGAQPFAALIRRLERLVGHRWFPRIATLMALLLLTASMAQWTWLIVKPPLPRIVSKTAPAAGTRAFKVQELLAAHLFGQAAPESVFADASLEDIPTSSLNLVLTGIVAAGSDSFALLRVNGQTETPFAVGEEIIHAVILQAVYPDRAIILRRGAAESLLLEDAAASLPTGAVVTALKGRITQQGTNRFTVDRGLISSQLRKPDFLRDALMVPNPGGGFLVRQIKPGSLYGKLGLRVGDVIRKVNGRTVNSVDDVMKVYQELGGLEELAEVRLEIMRAGTVQQLQYFVQ